MRKVLIITLALFITGCTSQQVKEETSRTFTAMGNFVKHVGSGVANFLGIELSDEDAEDVENTTQDALDQAKDGESTEWRNNDGVAATITTDNTRTEALLVDLTVRKGVTLPEANDFEVNGHPYKVVVDAARVRGQDTTQSEVVGSLLRNDIVTAIGQSKSTGWFLVGQNNTAIGYVRYDLIRLATQDEIMAYKTKKTQPTPSKQAELKTTDDEVYDLDAIDNEETVTQQLILSTECRDVTTEVVTNEGTQTNTHKACKTADGAWEL